MKKYLQQIWYEMRHQPLIGIVTLSATALAIFLIMVVVTIQQVKVAPFAPEINRDRMLAGHGMHVKSLSRNEDGSAMAISPAALHELYDSLPGVKALSVYVERNMENISVTGRTSMTAEVLDNDEKFWDIFSFEFIDGKPYDKAAVEAGMKEAVISESVARRMFDTGKASGREIKIAHIPYRVVGVVKDVSPLATAAYANVFIPYTSQPGNTRASEYGELFGALEAFMLIDEHASVPDIKKEVERRYSILSSRLKKQDQEVLYHGQPYTQEERITSHGSNNTPDTETDRNLRYAIYVILLLIPAINLGSITQSRLRRRISEIGIRRAFGCTRRRVILDILVENFIISLAGGIIGLLLAICFSYFYTGIFSDINPEYPTPQIDFSMIFHTSTFFAALLFCFLLNLISAGLPAWRASRVNPVEAINSVHK